MIYTREQFNEIGTFDICDFPIDSNDEDLIFVVFNHLPSHLQSLAITYGFNDTVFRDDVIFFLCKTQLGMGYEEYAKSEIGKDYFNNGTLIAIDFKKFNNDM